MQAVILAAGKGSRLHPLTLERSKAMMPVAGKPMVARVMDMLKQAGLQEFILVAHPEDHELHNYFSGSKNVTITYQMEQKGAAHALMSAAAFIKGDFILSACDNLVTPDEASAFVELFRILRGKGQDGLLALIRVPKEKMTSMGMVEWDGNKIQRIVEKPALETALSEIASIPFYGFSRHFLDYLPRIKPSKRGELELQDAMQMQIAENHALYGKILSGRMTVTNATDLLTLNFRFLDQEQTMLQKEFPGVKKFIPPCLVEMGAIISPGCTIGPNVLVEAGARIGINATLKNTLVLRNACVPDGENAENAIFS